MRGRIAVVVRFGLDDAAREHAPSSSRADEELADEKARELDRPGGKIARDRSRLGGGVELEFGAGAPFEIGDFTRVGAFDARGGEAVERAARLDVGHASAGGTMRGADRSRTTSSSAVANANAGDSRAAAVRCATAATAAYPISRPSKSASGATVNGTRTTPRSVPVATAA